MSRILITGGAGFIGSELANALEKLGHEVLLIDNLSGGYLDNLIQDNRTIGKLYQTDIRSPESEALYKGIDYVFHFAAISSLPQCQESPAEALSVNVAATAQVLENCRRNNVQKVVFASTSAIYENNKITPFKETDEVNPNLIYSLSKLNAEAICKSYIVNYGLPITTLRFFNVYGPNQNFRRKSPPLIGYIIRELINSRAPTLHSSGEQKRDYVYIDDVIDLALKCMTNNASDGKTFNLCSEETASVKDIFEIIAKKLDITNINPIYKESKNFWKSYSNLYTENYPLRSEIVEKEVNKYSLGTSALAKELLSWSPKTNLETGLGRIVATALKDIEKFKEL